MCLLRAVAHIMSIDYGMDDVPRNYSDMATLIASMSIGITFFVMIVVELSSSFITTVSGSSTLAYQKHVSTILQYL